jgi:hypothetical protein
MRASTEEEDNEVMLGFVRNLLRNSLVRITKSHETVLSPSAENINIILIFYFISVILVQRKKIYIP